MLDQCWASDVDGGSTSAQIGSMSHVCWMAHRRLPLVAHHTDVGLLAGGPLAKLFDNSGSSVVHQWQMSPSDCRLRVAGGQWLFCRL